MSFLDWLNPKEPDLMPGRADFVHIEPAHVIAERQLRDTALARAIDYAKTSLDHMDATAIVTMASRFHAFLSGGSAQNAILGGAMNQQNNADLERQYKGQP